MQHGGLSWAQGWYWKQWVFTGQEWPSQSIYLSKRIAVLLAIRMVSLLPILTLCRHRSSVLIVLVFSFLGRNVAFFVTPTVALRFLSNSTTHPPKIIISRPDQIVGEGSAEKVRVEWVCERMMGCRVLHQNATKRKINNNVCTWSAVVIGNRIGLCVFKPFFTHCTHWESWLCSKIKGHEKCSRHSQIWGSENISQAVIENQKQWVPNHERL